ncbi:amidohydrolase family protein, partial [Pantoea sp. SIMBA_079]
MIVRNANLPDGREKQDILVKDGKIADIVPSTGEHQAAQEIDATNRLVTPPFVDPHFHMDATLSLGLPRLNRSGTLL